MFYRYTHKRMASLLIGLAVGIPWIWDSHFWKPWAEENLAFMGGYQFVNVIVMTLFMGGVGACIIMMTSADGWDSKSFGAIERVKQFREAKLNGMSANDGANLMAQTQLLDMGGEQETDDATGRAKRHLNSRLSGMGQAQGLEWLRRGGDK